MAMLDLLRADAKPLGEHRIEHGGVALAGRLYVEGEDEFLPARKAQRSRLEREPAGMLQHAGNAKPAILAALSCRPPALLESIEVGERERLVEHGFELAAVDGGTDRRLVRHGGRLDQIAPAQFDRVDAGDAGGLVDHPLEHEIRLGATGTSVGRGGCRIGEDTTHADIDQPNVVHAG